MAKEKDAPPAAAPVTAADFKKVLESVLGEGGGATQSGYTIEQTYNEVFGLSAGEAQGEVLYARGVPQVKHAKVSTFRDAMKGIHGMDEVSLGRMQQRLWDAGFYPPATYKKGKSPQSGLADFDTVKAFQNLFSTSVMYQGKKTVDEILDDFKGTGGFYSEEERAAAARGFGGGVEVIQTTDPAALRQMTTRVAQGILGRAVSDHERDAIVSNILKAERAPQEQAIQAGIASEQAVAGAGAGTYVAPTVLEQTRIDAEARTAEAIERQNPEEAAGMAGAGMYEALIEMIRQGSG